VHDQFHHPGEQEVVHRQSPVTEVHHPIGRLGRHEAPQLGEGRVDLIDQRLRAL
jgi:hypothetical protein